MSMFSLRNWTWPSQKTNKQPVGWSLRKFDMLACTSPKVGGHCVRKLRDSVGESPVTVCELAQVRLLLSPLAYNAYDPVTGFLLMGSIVQAMTQPPRIPWYCGSLASSTSLADVVMLTLQPIGIGFLGVSGEPVHQLQGLGMGW